jgi:hypothetical protein
MPIVGRLAGAVGADEAEDLAACDLEVDPPHRLHPSRVGLAEPGHLDRHAAGRACVHLDLLGGRHVGRVAFVTAMTDASGRM